MRVILLVFVMIIMAISLETAYAEYCIESNGGTWHCFDDDYNNNDIDYSYVGVDITNDYWNNQKNVLNCYGRILDV